METQEAKTLGTRANSTRKRELHFPPLEELTKPTVDTATAAHYLNRSPHTLRIWSCAENGPIRPVRINNRLAWPVADIRRVLGIAG